MGEAAFSLQTRHLHPSIEYYQKPCNCENASHYTISTYKEQNFATFPGHEQKIYLLQTQAIMPSFPLVERAGIEVEMCWQLLVGFAGNSRGA